MYAYSGLAARFSGKADTQVAGGLGICTHVWYTWHLGDVYFQASRLLLHRCHCFSLHLNPAFFLHAFSLPFLTMSHDPC